MSADLFDDITGYLDRYPCERESMAECPLAESLWRMVRRILRTQNKRTAFEVRVLDEARRVADNHFGVVSRDFLAILVVNQFLARLSADRSARSASQHQPVDLSPQTLLTTSPLVR